MIRYQSLDVLRGIAILLVLTAHYSYPGVFSRPGWSGVDLFFVLSGFLISGLLFDEYQKTGSINLKRFWIRRGFKIYPAFYAMLLVVGIIFAGTGHLTRVFSDLFFLQDYIRPIAAHGWSLGVEEKFYFTLPLLLILLMRIPKGENSFRFIPFIFISLFTGCLALRVHGVLHFTWWEGIERPAHLRIDSLFAGVTLGYYRYLRPEDFQRVARWPLWIPGLALLAPTFLWPKENVKMVTMGFSLVTVGYSLIVLWAVARTLSESRSIRWLSTIGRYSYSIYLWHFVVRLFLAYDAIPHLAFLPAYICACLIAGRGAAYLIEMPALKLRDKLYPAQSRAAISLGGADLKTAIGIVA